jgi:hypothetical protein
MFILKLIHWFIAIMIWISSLLVPKRYLPFAMTLQILVMISWLVTGRCVLWDIQKNVDPTFKVGNDTSAEMLGFDRPTWLLITHTMIYMNTIMLGYRMNKLHEILLFVLLYMCINGKYLHNGDDDMSKY